FLYCTNNHYSGKKTDYQTNKQKKTNISLDVCLQSESPIFRAFLIFHSVKSGKVGGQILDRVFL
ncbi:TPA: hypothetical protein ACGO10_001673, partial [Streptococcus suis]